MSPQQPTPPTKAAGKRGLWWLWLAVAAILVLPVSLYLGPPVLAWVTPEPPKPAAPIPGYQKAPQTPGSLDAVTSLPSGAPQPDPAVLTKELDAALNIPGSGRARAVVLNAEDGSELYNRDGGEPSVPASNMKVLTALSVMNSMDPFTRLSTRVVQGQNKNSLVLVAGGDTMLSAGKSDDSAVLGRAGLATLAERTVKALAAAGVKGEVTVSLDDSLFQGETVSPAWHPADVAAGEATGVYPIAVDSAWGQDNRRERPKDAALSAAQAFRAALNKAGADAGLSAGGDVKRAKAPAEGVEEVARVESATIAEQVKYMLEESDNVLAEVLGRLAAREQGNVASFAGASQAVRSTLKELKIETKGVEIADVSGLALADRVPTAVLAQAMQVIATSDDPALRTILPGLPVSGETGTMANRGLGTATVGRVHAKSGTLNATSAVTGYVVTADSRVLVFSMIFNGLDGNLADGQAALDKAMGVLAGCGCR